MLLYNMILCFFFRNLQNTRENKFVFVLPLASNLSLKRIFFLISIWPNVIYIFILKEEDCNDLENYNVN